MNQRPRMFTWALAVLATACLGLASPALAQWGGYGGGGYGGGDTAPKNQFNIMMNYELGMHCTGFEFAYCCVLPPYNSILAQVVKTSKNGSFPTMLEADPHITDGLGRPYVLRDNFKKYVLRYWHDAQPRNDGRGAPQSSTLISMVEGNSLLMWNTRAEGAITDNATDPLGQGALIYGSTDGANNVVQGNGSFADANDNYWNAIWNHLYIYQDLEGTIPGGTSAEADKIRLGIQVIYPEDTGAALHPMGPGVVGAGFDNVLTFSGDTGTVVYTQMKVLENLPIMLTSPRIWEALGLPLTPFEDTINFFGDPGAVDEDTVRPYVRMRARLEEYPSGNPVLDNGQPVIGFGTAPIDIPNCERCHSLGDGTSDNSAQNGKPGIAAMVQDEIDFWNAYYNIDTGAGDSDWYSRLKGAAISILGIHDAEHGTSFLAHWPATTYQTCTAGNIGNACTRNIDCDTSPGAADGVCTGGTLTGDLSTRANVARLGHGSVMCQRCHADNVIAVVKSADCGANQNCDPADPRNELWSNITGNTLILPLTEAIHNNHADTLFADSKGRSGGCQGCHPAHRSDGDMSSYPITELGLNAFSGSDNRDAAGGCFVGRDVHSNRNKDADATTPSHLNSVGQWLLANVANDTGTWKGIWCTNCHSQLGQELWKTDNWSDPVHNVGTTFRNDASLAAIASDLGISLNLAESWLDPKVPSMAYDGVDHTNAVWTEDPGMCNFAGSLLGLNTADPYQDGNVATIEINLNDANSCSAGYVGVPGPDCGTNPGNPSFWICVKTDVDGDVNVHVMEDHFCSTPDCVAAAQATLDANQGQAAVPVPFSAATDGRDHWLAAGEPHCADCHQAPYVEQSGTQNFFPPFNYPNKPSLFRYSRGHRDITCQGCHESIHGLYPVTSNIDTTSYAQAASMNTDGSHGPLKCGACHAANSNGVLSWADDLSYQGTKIKDSFDKAVSWMHTATDEADPRADICKNCHGDKADEIYSSGDGGWGGGWGGWGGGSSEWNSEWLKHTMKDRVSRNTMDKVEIAEVGHVAGDPAFEDPLTTVCRGCHGDNSRDVSCGDHEWKDHLTEGRVSPAVWEYVAMQESGSTCGY